MKRALVLAPLTALLALTLVTVFACTDDVVGHIFRGRKYDVDNGCLAVPTAVDVVEGADPGEGCPLGCLLRTEEDGGKSVYIATTCPPYPPDFARADETPICQDARLAATQKYFCSTDAGRITKDAGADAAVDASSAAIDASPDAGSP